ncbi:adenylate/guanylate cyclase domain-containing protein [Legionella brunensis]|uniref:adenylate/guanylate cyclase domain-containing protein n=1 Tax=Legionella brunensis TaxID=29422 RepID=UPI00104170CE|nr:adenylate/guanylate cyclase domain-containing protein [Legionella brunensis]
MKGRLYKKSQAGGFKVSIHVSIITLFVLLLSLVGFSIIGLQYYALNKILSSSAKHLIEQTSLLVKERLLYYLLPLSHDLMEIKNMVDYGIVDPENTKQFDLFLMESIQHSDEIFMVYYGTAAGDFYGVDREKQGIIGLNHIVNSQKPPSKIRYEYDKDGHLLSQHSLSQAYDPRPRPWYQQAIRAGKPVWTDIYPFYLFGKGSPSTPGITAAAPIYDDHNQLKGVIALDLTIESLQYFIQNLEVTKNTIIYIINEKKQVIAYRDNNYKKDIRGQILLPEMSKHFPSFPANKAPPQFLVTSYRDKGQDFFLAYQTISNKETNSLWQIIIIVPANDILAPLKSVSIHNFLLTLLILFLGILIVRYISQKISRPIIYLAKEAKEITRLDLTPRPLLKTIIREISYMDKSLKAVRSSLTSFQRYVPSSLVKKLMRSGKIAKVGGESQDITILFSDIKDFTKLAEETEPKQLMTYLSEYFQLMTETVIQHQGTLDKYIGDAVMAIWNAPTLDRHHALHACQTAVCMIERVKELNQKNQGIGFPNFSIRIGINSGEAVIGNVGSEDRLSFTALGDTVNLANRLEGINKIYHTQIIITQSTFKQVGSSFVFRLLDEVAMRGKQVSTTIYELITEPNIPNLAQHKEEFALAFAKYQSGDWIESLKLFENLTPAYNGDALALIYINRCQDLINSPPTYWDGIWRPYQDKPS